MVPPLSELSDDSEEGVLHATAPLPPSIDDLFAQAWGMDSSSTGSADSDVIVGTKRHRAAFVPSNEVSFHVVDVSVIEEDLSTHIAKGSVPLSYHSIPADQLFDPLLG
jgi:hypothetical protein